MSESVPPELVALGNAIKRVRKRRKKSQRQIAEASGIHLTTFKEIENATVDRVRRPGTLENIASALSVTLEYLKDLANNRVTLEEPDDPVVRILKDMRKEFNGKFSSLEEHMEKINADRVRQHADLLQRVDALHRLIRSPEVNIDLSRYHGQNLPED